MLNKKKRFSFMMISAVLAIALTGLSSSCERSLDTKHDKAQSQQKDTETSMKVEENESEMPDTGLENELPDKSNTGSGDATEMDTSSSGAGMTGSQNDLILSSITCLLTAGHWQRASSVQQV